MPSLDRRSYLALALSVATGLAGCPNDDLPEQTPPTETETSTPTTTTPQDMQSQESLYAGAPSRKLASTSDRQISIPGDYDSIQAAIDQIPVVMRHKWQIEIDAGTYDEDVIVPPYLGEWARPGQQERVPIQITGNRQNPTDVTVNSLFATTVLGTIPLQFRGMEITSTNPYDDERTGVGIYGCSEVGLIDVVFSGGHNGVHAYNSQVMVRNVDFGENVLSGHGISVKHGGFAYENIDEQVPTTGTVGRVAYNALSGQIWFAGGRSTLTGSRFVEERGGFVHDYGQQASYGPNRYYSSDQSVGDNQIQANAALITISDGEQAELSTITDGQQGDQLILVAEDNIVVKHGVGNIRLGSGNDRNLDNNDTLTLVNVGGSWLETAYGENG